MGSFLYFANLQQGFTDVSPDLFVCERRGEIEVGKLERGGGERRSLVPQMWLCRACAASLRGVTQLRASVALGRGRRAFKGCPSLDDQPVFRDFLSVMKVAICALTASGSSSLAQHLLRNNKIRFQTFFPCD